MSDKERQLDEIEALKWIYPQELTVVTEWPASGLFKISPTLIEDELCVKTVTKLNGTSEERMMRVKYLPPIELFFKCPEDYPGRSEPMFMVNCIWLSASKLTKICHKFDQLWDESFNSEILFSWTSFLKEDCCSFLCVEDLCITLDMDSVVGSSNTQPKDSINQKSIKLKELKNKRTKEDMNHPSLKMKIRKSKNHRKTRTHCDQENFKYETPKDLEKKDANTSLNVSVCPSSNECSLSKNEKDAVEKEGMSQIDHILQAMSVYGRRNRIRSTDFDSRVVPNYETLNLANVIAEYNDRRLDVEFRSQMNVCNICFENKLGSLCVCVKPCRHAFCKECFTEYLTVNIKESQVQKLCCLDPDCDTMLSAQQIKQSVDEATFDKYVKFSRKMLVQNDANLLYCPRKFCQGIARLYDKGKDMGYCEQCAFYFCAFCNRSYHGVEMCKIKSDEVLKVIQEYQTAGPVRKAELEKRFSKQQLTKWVQDDLTEKLIKQCSKPCPNCGALIEKDHGCNKMQCFNCNVPFCWLCNACLSLTVPYAHYQNKTSPCYEKLFPQQFEDDDDDEFFIFEDLEDGDEFDDFRMYYYDEALAYFSDSD